MLHRTIDRIDSAVQKAWIPIRVAAALGFVLLIVGAVR